MATDRGTPRRRLALGVLCLASFTGFALLAIPIALFGLPGRENKPS